MRIPESRQFGTTDTIPLHPQTAGRDPDFMLTDAVCPVKVEEPLNQGLRLEKCLARDPRHFLDGHRDPDRHAEPAGELDPKLMPRHV
jgi:hypothetical protein